ncbi:MAG: GntR family transcriptional regulator [Acidimicrobiaceae bacterium]|nr:GntR family transcriptional regulator [Acidimicrobiaceae bacterium]
MSEVKSEVVPLLLNRTTATEAATDAVRGLILSGAIPPGSLIRQDLLSKRLGVSRTPLREALQRLTVEGLIRLDHHRGAVAAAPSITELREIYELQEMLECVAARDALKHFTDADLADLRDCIDELSRAETSVEWIRGNLAFHTTMYRISEKKLVVEMITQLRNRAILYINMVARSGESRKRAEADHIEMVAVLASGDGDRLEELIRSHLRATLAWVESIIV